MRAETHRTLGLAGAGLSALGLGASVYLTIAHYESSTVLACPDRGVVNCAKVTSSSYATQFGIPLVLFGLAFFAVMLAVQTPWAWQASNRVLRNGRMGLAAAGTVTAVWLIWVELFRLDAICLYCTVAHVAAIALFILTGLGTAVTVDQEPVPTS